MAEHPPHDGIEPRAEDERHEADMVDGDLVASLSAHGTLDILHLSTIVSGALWPNYCGGQSRNRRARLQSAHPNFAGSCHHVDVDSQGWENLSFGNSVLGS